MADIVEAEKRTPVEDMQAIFVIDILLCFLWGRWELELDL
jgi:hypothetical protein